ncbi:MAG: Rieske 2Fe-2S domain-containing protein [Bacteroidota bacterium]
MTRKEFLNQVGVGAALVMTGMCFQQCSREPSGTVDLTLDLTDPEYADLSQDGGFVVVEEVVVARTSNGDYVAATQICSHQGFKQVKFNADDEFQCSVHGARFDLQGDGLNSNGSGGLTIYNTELTADTLRVFS